MTPGLRVRSGVKHSGGALPSCASSVHAVGLGYRSDGVGTCCTSTAAVQERSGCRVENVAMAAGGQSGQAQPAGRARVEQRACGSRSPGQ